MIRPPLDSNRPISLARRRAEAKTEEWHDAFRRVVYDLAAVPVDGKSKPTMETRRQADRLFARLKIAGRKLNEKRHFFHLLFHAGKLATHLGGCVRVNRNRSTAKPIELAVLDAVVAAHLFEEFRSPPGSPKSSRLVPLGDVMEATERDPWLIEPGAKCPPLVVLRKRGTDCEELDFDPDDPVPRMVQAALERICAVNAAFDVRVQLERWTGETVACRLRPVHYAVFTDDFAHHGRLYTGKFGHQSLRKIERATITFNGVTSCELDFSAMHPRLCYHLRGLECPTDPYDLWPGEVCDLEVRESRRLLVKQVLLAAINAPTRDAVINTCNLTLCSKTASGEKKTGAAAEETARIWRARRKTGLTFANIFDRCREVHAPIVDDFGSDAGLRLMRTDSRIALHVMSFFAHHKFPILGVHDSFIVPAFAADVLQSVMTLVYHLETDFSPVVK